MRYRFHIVNVCTSGGRLTGNPLCVFEDGSSLDPEAMQGLARQFNLSETTFRDVEVTVAELAVALGLRAADIVAEPSGRRPLWVNAGSEQLVASLGSREIEL